jgi:hypothetical protein
MDAHEIVMHEVDRDPVWSVWPLRSPHEGFGADHPGGEVADPTGGTDAVYRGASDLITRTVVHDGETGSISDGSLFFTFPTRLSTGHIVIRSAG